MVRGVFNRERTLEMNDTELKHLLAKMLPDRLQYHGNCPEPSLWFDQNSGGIRKVLDTELLHLCSLVESSLNTQDSLISDRMKYSDLLCRNAVTAYDSLWLCLSATWQQRTEALAKVKGVTL